MSTDFFNTIPLDLFTPNKKGGIVNIFNLLVRAESHSKKSKHIYTKSNYDGFNLTIDSKYFPMEMQKYIKLNAYLQETITITIGSRTIKVNFITMKNLKPIDLNKYTDGLTLLFSLMDMLCKNRNINKILNVDIFLTPFTKKMPNAYEHFTSNHINSALTHICNESGNIIIYREEEWFKVLIHECIHSFCLDFSGQDQKLLGKCILNYFPIHVENLLLSETYAETWAEILNNGIISFLEGGKHKRLFSLYFNFYMQVEIVHSIFQANKILSHYNSSYQTIREKKITWNQKTHIYEYHVLKTILLFSFDKFILWCAKNNGNDLIPYRGKLFLFCDLIRDSYYNKNFLNKVRRIGKRNNGNSMRMSINEI